MTHSELVIIAYKYCLRQLSCGVAFRELKTLHSEICDVIGFGSGGHSVLIEVKISRSDFLADKKKPFRSNPQLGAGKNRYYCCPENLIKVEELPEGWGLIYVDSTGKAVMKHKPLVELFNINGNPVKRVYEHKRHEKAERGIMYSALRRLQITGHIDLYHMEEEKRKVTKTIQNNTP